MTDHPRLSPDTPDRYARLDAARWLAALAVVLLHSSTDALNLAESFGSTSWLAANVYDSASRWCVPVFVMISGALMLNDGRPTDLRQFYGRRVARIVVPLVFWSLFYLAWRNMLSWLDEGRIDWQSNAIVLAKGTPYYHLWYLYMIVGLYLFTPFMRNLYARTSPRARVACAGAILLVAMLDTLYRQVTGADPGFFLTLFLPYLGYFVAGKLIVDGALRIPRPALVLSVSVIVTAAGFYLLSSPGQLHPYFYNYFSLNVAAMSLAAFQLIVDARKLQRLPALGRLTFGVYLVHPVFIDLATRLGWYKSGTHDMWAIPVLAAAVFGSSAALCWALQRTRATRRVL